MKKLFCFLFLSYSLFAQVSEYQFISPVPGSDFNTRESTIIIRQGVELGTDIIDSDVLRIVGSKSGRVDGELVIANDGKTIVFKPDQFFEPGEEVRVFVSGGMELTDGNKLPEADFTFEIAPFLETPNPYEYIPELRPHYFNSSTTLQKSAADTIPSDFPDVKVEMIDSAALGNGYIFMSVASDIPGVGYYLMMLNNDGTPVFMKDVGVFSYDFKLQPNGMLSYAHFYEHFDYTGGGNVVHKLLDKTLTVVDSVQMGNGYIAEAHDFQALPNGHFLLFGYYLTKVDMSKYVKGGKPNALVSGAVVQELDADRNVVFQWRSWDNYDYADYAWNARATRSVVSAFHINTINLDDDQNIFIATPQWAKKLNRQTSEVMWTIGGADNDFSFVGVDSTNGVEHFGGHNFHRIENGNVLIYDNGSSRRINKTSLAHEYKLDEINLIAEHIWTYTPDSTIAGTNRGNAQRLANGNTVIGWGGPEGKANIPAFTEVDASGKKLMEVSFTNPKVVSYRSYRFPFTPSSPSAEVTITEVVAGNTYEFSKGDSVLTGAALNIKSFSGSGYNEVTAKKYNFAPLYPQFPGKAPRVIPQRVVFSASGINSVKVDIEIDAANWGVKDPSSIVIYNREYEGGGLFIPLATSYNSVTKKLSASSSKLGEFIIAMADLQSLVFVPELNYPADSATVNQTLPLTLVWNPVGYVNDYSLTVSKKIGNALQLIVEANNITEAKYTLDSLDSDAEYFWSVKASNDGGASAYSKEYMFKTVAPWITVNSPNGGESYQRGLKHYVKWDDNIEEEVVLSIHGSANFASVIDTVKSDRAFEWNIPTDLPIGDYMLKISSVVDTSVYDFSDAVFSVIDTVTAVAGKQETPNEYKLFANFPNPFNPETQIQFTVPVAVQARLSVYNVLGELQAVLYNDFAKAGTITVRFNASSFNSGVYVYKLEAGEFMSVRKMILMK